MTTTPTVWRPTTVVNSGFTTGQQSDPFAVETRDGRIFTLWADDTDNADAATGDDVVGRRLDYYQGQGPPAHVNLNVSEGDESRARVAALPDGGLFTVYHSTANGNDVHYIRHDAAGNAVSSGSIAVGANNYNRPSVALLGNNTLAIGYTSEGTDDNYGVVVFDLATNSTGPRLTFDDPTGPNAGGTSIEMAALGGDRWVAVYAAELTPVLPPFNILELRVRVYDSSAEIAAFTIPDTENASSLQVASVLGGGFVVAYDPFSASNFHARRYDGDGGAIGGVINLDLPVGAFGTTLHDVVGLKEGGFYVLYENGATGALAGQRYSDAGAAVGAANVVSTGGADEGSLSLTEDGRIIVSWSNGGDIRQQILDPRDVGLAIIGNENNEILSARVEGSWVLGGGGQDRLLGWHGPDRLEGGNDADILKGGAGADVLLGGAAQDTVEGGSGDDTYILGLPGVTIGGDTAILDILVEQPGSSGGNDTVEVEFHDIPIGGGFAFFFETYTLPDNIENGIVAGGDFFQLIGNGLDNRLSGNAAVNWLAGGDGADRLDGGAGDDTMNGGPGNDTFVADSAGDVLTEADGQGIDSVETQLATYSLFSLATLERLTYTGAGNFTGRGNGLDNRIQGAAGNDRFVVDQGGADRYFGDAGAADQMDFRAGALGAVVNLTTGIHGGAAAGDFFSSIEYFYGSDTAGDSFTGGAFNDRLDGYGGNDMLFGLGGNDTLMGGNGDDEMSGGALLDFLHGNTGADDFNYAALSDSSPTSGARDRIYDFQAGSDDIDVSAIDARASSTGNNAFSQFLGAATFTGEGQVRWYQAGANTVIEFNTTGTSGAEMQIQLQNFTAATLSAGDFIA